MRGPGDIYGTRQSGALDFKIADIVHDVDIMEETKEAAVALLTDDPYLEREQHRRLREELHKNRNRQVLQWSKIS
jgi:ATP-dependent DNA helicase RecG